MAKMNKMLDAIQFANNSLFCGHENAKYDVGFKNGEIEIIINEVERFNLQLHDLSQVPYKLDCRYKPSLFIYPDDNNVNKISSLVNLPTILERLVILDAPYLNRLPEGEYITCCALSLCGCGILENFIGCPTITESIEINNCTITSLDGLEDNFQGSEIFFYNEMWENKHGIGKKVFYSFDEFKEWFSKTYRRIS